MQKVRQLESVVSAKGGVRADGVVVLRQESLWWSMAITPNFVSAVNLSHAIRLKGAIHG